MIDVCHTFSCFASHHMLSTDWVCAPVIGSTKSSLWLTSMCRYLRWSFKPAIRHNKAVFLHKLFDAPHQGFGSSVRNSHQKHIFRFTTGTTKDALNWVGLAFVGFSSGKRSRQLPQIFRHKYIFFGFWINSLHRRLADNWQNLRLSYESFPIPLDNI